MCIRDRRASNPYHFPDRCRSRGAEPRLSLRLRDHGRDRTRQRDGVSHSPPPRGSREARGAVGTRRGRARRATPATTLLPDHRRRATSRTRRDGALPCAGRRASSGCPFAHMNAPIGGRPPGSWLIRQLARIIPRAHRESWRDEWIGELSHSPLPPWRLRLRALGAIVDALWLARHHSSWARLDSTRFGHDVRYAARSLARRPAFSLVVVGTLALCIGATSSVFSVVESVLLRGLDYRDLNRLVAVWSNNAKESNDHYQASVSYTHLRAHETGRNLVCRLLLEKKK